jgi:hypothetical protein
MNFNDDDLLSSDDDDKKRSDSSDSLGSLGSDDANVMTIRKPKQAAVAIDDDLAYLDDLLDDDDLGIQKDDDDDFDDDEPQTVQKKCTKVESPKIGEDLEEDIIAGATVKMPTRGPAKAAPTRKQALTKEGGSRPVISF